MQDGIRLVRQARGVLPEAVVLCLCPRGDYRVPGQAEDRISLGWTSEALAWKVVELWTLAAEELLAAPNVGVVPWATLAATTVPPKYCCNAAATVWSGKGEHSRQTCWR